MTTSQQRLSVTARSMTSGPAKVVSPRAVAVRGGTASCGWKIGNRRALSDSFRGRKKREYLRGRKAYLSINAVAAAAPPKIDIKTNLFEKEVVNMAGENEYVS